VVGERYRFRSKHHRADGHTGHMRRRDTEHRGRKRRAPDDQPVLPDRTSDEHELGWGDEPAERDDEWYRRERPPHHE